MSKRADVYRKKNEAMVNISIPVSLHLLVRLYAHDRNLYMWEAVKELLTVAFHNIPEYDPKLLPSYKEEDDSFDHEPQPLSSSRDDKFIATTNLQDTQEPE